LCCHHNSSVIPASRGSNASAIREELRRSIPAELLAGRSFNSDSLNGQIGGLRRQLDRKRGGMSVRALMENYGELITQILPCTLMSPDSVARFFPARPDLFDVVVFDEASQIRVADAIGAMGRAIRAPPRILCRPPLPPG
jgi:superfamily I DNA and/or RNA helicase